MADRLARGVAHLASRLKTHASQDVTYSRGVLTCPLKATRGKTAYQASDEQGVVLEFESADWIITAADLVLSGSQATPQTGDRVTHSGQVYEVMPLTQFPDEAGRCYRPVGNTEALIRIHTKQIEE